MCPNIDNTIIGIQNPGTETAEVINPGRGLSAEQVIEAYGAQIEKGAFVSLTNRNLHDNTVSVTNYIADVVGTSVYLQSNEFGDSVNIDEVGAVAASGEVAVIEPEQPTEPYTVVGTDDDDEPFVAIVAASSPEQAKSEGIAAALVDEGYEYAVTVVAVFQGDLNGVNVTDEAG